MLFITHESPVTVLAVSVRLHMSIISQEGLMWAAFKGRTEVILDALRSPLVNLPRLAKDANLHASSEPTDSKILNFVL